MTNTIPPETGDLQSVGERQGIGKPGSAAPLHRKLMQSNGIFDNEKPAF
jgi:hypothetical protein